MGRPEEIAAVVRFLDSGAASYVTGEVIDVMGGGPGGQLMPGVSGESLTESLTSAGRPT